MQFTMPTRLSKIKVNNGMSDLIRHGQSVKNLYLRFAGMEQEKETLNRLKMRLYHTSNQDVGLIEHHR